MEAQLPPDILQAIIQSQNELLQKIGTRRFYQKLFLEMHPNGTIKTLSIKADPLVIATLGLAAIVLASAVVCLIGPSAVVTALQAMLKAKGISACIIILS